jgi:T5SS/PEP-CTERM-associated repeat protein
MKALRRFFVVSALVALAPPAPAVTNVVDGVATNLSGVSVSAGDAFIARNGAVVSNSFVAMAAVGGAGVILTGSGTVWTNLGTFYVGSTVGRSYNVLTVNSNATLFMSPSTFNVGNGDNSFSNTAYVTDGGYINLSSGGKVDNGFDNMIVVSNGGRLRSGGSLTIGDNSSFLANAARASLRVVGTGSLVDSLAGGNTLVVGNATRDASLTVAQGGLVSNGIVRMGIGLMASNASAVVSDLGSRWITAGLYVGQAGQGASVLVTNSGYLKASDLYIGAAPTAFNNRVTVTGSGSLLDVGSFLRVGGADGVLPGGSSNGLFILNGGTVSNVTGVIGLTAASSNNQVVVAGAGSAWRLSGGLTIGDAGFGGALLVTNGGVVRMFGTLVAGSTTFSRDNRILVSGAGSVLEAAGVGITVGSSGHNNSIQVLDGGVVSNGNTTAVGSSSTNNLGVVAGAGSRWVVTNNYGLYVGQGAGSGFNKLFVTNGGVVNAVLTVGAGGLGSNEVYIGSGGIVSNAAGNVSLGGTATHYNKVTISDAGSEWYSGGLLYLGKGNNNTVLVTNGGRLRTANTIYIPDTSGTNNLLRVVGVGSYVSAGGGINWREGQFGRVEVLGGGVVESPSHYILGSAAAYSNNTLLVSGEGSLVKGAQLQMHLSPNNQAIVTDGGTLDVNTMLVTRNSVVSNSGGVFQFAVAPVLTVTGGGAVYVNDATISFRDTSDAIAAIAGSRFTNFTFSGNNSFRLQSASNEAGTAYYTVDAGSPSTAYQRLVLAGTNALWRSGVLNIGAGGELYTSNSVGATIAAIVTNSGTVRVFDSILTYQSNVVVSGGSFITQRGTNQFLRGLNVAANSTLTFTSGASRVTGVISNSAGSTIQAINSIVTFQDAVVVGGLYYSDPSTNVFATNVTVTASGALQGGAGDLFVFNRDLTMQSTNRSEFNLVNAAVLFTNSAFHNLNLSGSGALDKGSNWLGIADLTTNFAVGTLSIAPGNKVVLQGDAGVNALYVGWLDIQGMLTNTYDQVTNGIFSALGLPSINLYYDQGVAGNDYLQGQTYSLWGGSLLIPIPEPSSALALGAGLAAFLFLSRRRRDQ